MYSYLRVCTCLWLVGNVASLGTSMIQSNAYSMERELGHPVVQGPQPSKTAEPEALLSNLRGTETADQQFGVMWIANEVSKYHVSNQSSEASKFMSASESHAGASSRTTDFMGVSMTRVFAFLFMIMITMVSLFIICSSEETSSAPITAKTREELSGLASCDGTWATTYQEENEQGKQGLELLFRCHIIPTEEFAHSKVNQEHINECVWIADNMLKQKKLEEWLEECEQAQLEFEESVTACFAARRDVRSSFFDSMQGASQSSQSPRSLLASNAGSKNKSGSDAKDDLPPILKTPADRKSLMERCRQIMAKSDSQRKPGDPKSTPSSPAPKSSLPSASGSRGQPSNAPPEPSYNLAQSTKEA